MLLINQIKLKPGFSYNDLLNKVCAVLKVLPDDILGLEIERQSIDARKKPDIFYIISAVVRVSHEESVLKRLKNNDQVSRYEPVVYNFSDFGSMELTERPVVVGAGPCGLFAAYYLAINGYKPIVLERGFDVDSRTNDVKEFWETGKLIRNSNVLFGEGGAGAFSDGKLNTLVKDKYGRNKEVLKLFVKHGANPEILYDAKPHVGTDVLVNVVKGIRDEIKANGGEFRYNAELTDICVENGRVTGIVINGLINLKCEALVLAIGHSARNTFKMLYDKGITLEQKDFAVGLRIEHRQAVIDKALYSDDPEVMKLLPHASYKLTHKAEDGRGVYSFCMCPGGYVVNASSEPEALCVNGMSYSSRNGLNANSAIVVSVGSDDFGSDHPLAGIEFQRKLERKAYEIGSGDIPVQFYGDFKANVFDTDNLNDPDLRELFAVSPEMKGRFTFGKVSDILPKALNEDLIDGIEYFGRIIPGFNDDFAVLSGVESRTSSPVRIVRNENLESVSLHGLFPCGEGAGYAGGITSAAMDGIRAFEAVASKYKPF